MKYRKKPVVIEAWHIEDLLKKASGPFRELPKQVLEAYESGGIVFGTRCLYVKTLEGDLRGEIDDMLICGVAGELYPCKPDIFAATYEIALKITKSKKL